MKLDCIRNDFMARQAATGMSQVEIARLCGIPQPYISRFRAGRSLSFEVVLKLWPFIYGCEFPMPAGGEHGSQA